ncbi:MAG TPA: carboxypeptidase-like regulatory domain-containing protein [Gemmataceae bacterium]
MMKRAEATFGVPRCWTWLVLPAILLSLGCGGPKGAVSGRVTYLDKPLPGGTVTFFGSENRVAGSSDISLDGIYSMVKVPTGPVTITVTAPTAFIRDPNAPKLPPVPTGKGEKQKGWEKRIVELRKTGIRLTIPAKYSMPEQSGLTYTVQPGSQEHNIDLK